jgi:hypothetical protein
MWECSNCKQEIEDRYRHCWNCGNSKTETPEVLDIPKIHPVVDEPPSEAEPAPQKKFPSADASLPEDKFLSKYGFSSADKPGSKILKLIPFVLWLAAVIFMAGFAYYSSQRTDAFENRIAEEAKNLNTRKDRFVFSKNAPRAKITLKPKVLPLDAKNNEVDSLYGYLPDDLRPAALDEVKTIMWLDCRSDEFGRYEDGTTAYRDKCIAYLIDKDTSKLIEVEDFLGEMPPASKRLGNNYAYGKVPPEAYISFIRENQPESERTADKFSSDSPHHHFVSKSELLYSIILLSLLGAVGLGWIVYKIKSANWRPD